MGANLAECHVERCARSIDVVQAAPDFVRAECHGDGVQVGPAAGGTGQATRTRQGGRASGRPAAERDRVVHAVAALIKQGSLRSVSRSENAQQRRRLTPRGAATRARIVAAAVELMHVKGVNATTLDDVRAASNTSKSQLYNHFQDKEDLVRAVVAARAAQVIERERGYLQRLKSFRGLVRWRDALLQRNSLRNGAYGCALGSLASELADQDDQARATLAESFVEWEELLAAGLRRMRDSGVLSPDADPEKLATGLMAALQGGYLLAETAHDTKPMEIALDMALDHVRSFLTT